MAAARAGNHNVFAWQETETESVRQRIYLQRMTDDGVALDGRGVPVAESDRDQLQPAIGGSLVVWVETASGVAPRLRAARLDPAGRVVDAPPFELGTAAADAAPAVAAIGSTHLVAWKNGGGDIVAARVSPTVGLLDPQPIPLSALDKDLGNPSIATDGSNFLVVWGAAPWRGVGLPTEWPAPVQAVAVTRTGIRIGTPVDVAPFGTEFTHVAWNGVEYVVLWYFADERDGYFGLWGRRVGRAGNLAGAAQQLMENVAPIAVAASGDTLLVMVAPARLLRLDRTLQIVETTRLETSQRMPVTDVALLLRDPANGWLAYATRGGGAPASRIVARRIGSTAGARRRSVAH